MIGETQRDEERVCERARAERGRKHDVAHESGNARDERQPTDRQKRAEHCSLAGLFAVLSHG